MVSAFSLALDQPDKREQRAVHRRRHAERRQPDAFEQDDADRTAGKPIAVGASQLRNRCDDGLDWAVLSITTSGSYTVATSALGASADTFLEIHTATSTAPLAANNNVSVNGIHALSAAREG